MDDYLITNSPTESIWKDIIQIATLIVTAGTALYTVKRISHEIKDNREQRQKESEIRENELRWKQANLAKTVLDEMFKDPYARDAMRMLESKQRRYKMDDGNFKQINFVDVIQAISSDSPEIDVERQEIQRFVKDCFDHFFAVMQDLEHYIDIGLIRVEDVKYPFNYYAEKIKPHKEIFEQYMVEDQPKEALLFLRRFF